MPVLRGSKRLAPRKSSVAKRRLVPRPSKWYREPLDRTRLLLIDPREQPLYVAQERLLRLETLKAKIRELRRYSDDFGAESGITLRTRELVRLPDATYQKVLRAADKLSRATARPFITVSPRTKTQRAAAIRVAGEILPRQRRFLIHTENASKAKATFYGGEVKITDTVKGGELYEIKYYFKRRPKSWNDVVVLTKDLQRKGMKAGNYKLINTLYGDIGLPITLNKLQEGLESYYGTYNTFMAGTILGWRWYGSSLDLTYAKEKKVKRVEQRFREVRDYQKYKESRRLLEISRGAKVQPCRFCKKKKCECKPPEFK